jgi:hypothetical protein
LSFYKGECSTDFDGTFVPYSKSLIAMLIYKLKSLAAALLVAPALFGQIGFSPAPVTMLPDPHYSGVAVAIMDMNGDGLDDLVRLAQGRNLNVAYQNAPNQPFTTMMNLGSMGNDSQWGMCTADINNDGMGDVLAGGAYDGVKIATSNSDGSAFSTLTMSLPPTFTQCVNMFDVNNDGWLDAFVCHDDGVSRIFGNNADGTFTYQAGWIDLSTNPPSDNSGNYGSVFSDVNNDGFTDLYIAKCRQGVNSSTDPRRINQLFINNGNGTFTQDIANTSGLRIGAQSWTADFGDIDNDGDFDCFITNHDVSSQVLLNDGSGHFSDITQSSGMLNAVFGLPLQGVFTDFDNDSWVDIVVAGTQHQLFRNNGNNTFTEVQNIMPGTGIGSFAIGDLNHDGYQDIYACYQNIYTDPSTTPDQLWLNNGGTNHFIGFALTGGTSNKSAVGAKTTIHTPQGIQVREVRSGQSYGISNSLHLHFGLGANTVVDSVVIRWPSGVTEVLKNPVVDTYNNVSEGGCVTVPVSIVSVGQPIICTGGAPLQINGPEGYNYLWSNGDTTQNIVVGQAGTYRLTVTDAEGNCSVVSNSINVTADPVEYPTIGIEGDGIFCKGGSVILTSSPSTSYQWSNGATTQVLEVTESGQYSVTTQGFCGLFTSQLAIGITVIDADEPAEPIGDVTNPGGFAILSAQGDSLHWYDAPAGGNLVGTGDSLNIPVVNQTTSYWVENLFIQDRPNEFGGMPDHQGSNFSSNSTNGSIVFDALVPFILHSVKVYTNAAGTRKIDLLDDAGTLLATETVNISAGTSQIILDMPVPVGSNLSLTTDAEVNQANFGFASPALRRADAGINYPYTIPEVLNIKGSNFGANRYYYFFNWEIDYPGLICNSDRIEIVAQVDSLSSTSPLTIQSDEIRLMPNPTDGTTLQVDLPNNLSGTVQYMIFNEFGQVVRQETTQIQRGNHRIPVDELPRGMYTIQWRHALGQWQARFVRI